MRREPGCFYCLRQRLTTRSLEPLSKRVSGRMFAVRSGFRGLARPDSAASEGRCQTACKPGSVRARHERPDAGRPFLWDAHRCAPRATNPGDGTGMSPRTTGEPVPPAAPIRSCSRWGLPCRPCCQGRGALLPHRFTLARRRTRAWERGRAVCFLWHCPWGRPRRPLTGTVFPWSPDFPPPQVVRQRPSSRLAPAFCGVAPHRSRPAADEIFAAFSTPSTPAHAGGLPPPRRNPDACPGPLALPALPPRTTPW